MGRTAKKKSGVKPPQEEWDFSTCPPERRFFCFGYEFAREVEPIKDAYSKAKASRKGFDEYGNWVCLWRMDREPVRGPFLMVQGGSLLLHLPPGFPGTPYLKTQHRLPKELRINGRDLTEWATVPPLVETATVENGKVYTEDGTAVPVEEVYTLFVNWNAPDTTVGSAFERWAAKHRPRPPVPTRANASLARLLESELKALSAHRLLKTLSITEAMNYAFDLNVGKNGMGLFTDSGDWSKADRRAKALIQMLADQRIDQTGDASIREASESLSRLLLG